MNRRIDSAEFLEAAIEDNRKWLQNHAHLEHTQKFQKTLECSQMMSDKLLALQLAGNRG